METIHFTYDYPYIYYSEEGNGRFTWQWASSRFTLNGCYTYPLVFRNQLPKCSHINLDLEITNTGSGSVLGLRWDLKACRGSSVWYTAMQFTLPNDGHIILDCDIGNYNISQLAFVPSSNPGSSRAWEVSCTLNRVTITESLEEHELTTGKYQYGIFPCRYGLTQVVTEVYANTGGALVPVTGILANIDDELVPIPPVYSAHLKTSAESTTLYRFSPPEDGTYRIKRKWLSGDHEIRLYDSTFHPLHEDYFYSESFDLDQGSLYYITLSHYYTAEESESYLQIYKEA